MFLIIDNISKFISVDNCYSILMERLKRINNKEVVSRDFEGNIVMASYG